MKMSLERTFGSGNIPEYVFVNKSYVMKVNWQSYEKSEFDIYLQSTWMSKEHLCRYKLKIDEGKKLEGIHGFLAKLNVNRAVNRREPENIQSIKQPFNHDKFNFTKINSDEVMFSLVQDSKRMEDDEKDYFIINVSPLDGFNCLLCPSLNKCLNQIVTEHSLYMALNTLLLSSTPEMRIGFNSLCAFASVNHLHFHAYYLSDPMKLEIIKVDLLVGRCYTLEEFPSKGFVFQLTSPGEISDIVNDVFQLVNFLSNENVAHNIYMTRGLNFARSAVGEETTERDVIRIYIWARTSSCGAKVINAFNPALAEMFGHLVVKTKEEYDLLNEANVASILQSVTEGPFLSVKERVKDLFISRE